MLHYSQLLFRDAETNTKVISQGQLESWSQKQFSSPNSWYSDFQRKANADLAPGSSNTHKRWL